MYDLVNKKFKLKENKHRLKPRLLLVLPPLTMAYHFYQSQ